VVVEVSSQLLNRLGVTPFGHKQHPALERISGQGDVVVAASTRGLVDGQRLYLAEVGPAQGVSLAHRHHPLCRLAHQARHGRERHLLRQGRDQRLKQQREARQARGKVGLASNSLAVISAPRFDAQY
jgi:hypothetical protein